MKLKYGLLTVVVFSIFLNKVRSDDTPVSDIWKWLDMVANEIMQSRHFVDLVNEEIPYQDDENESRAILGLQLFRKQLKKMRKIYKKYLAEIQLYQCASKNWKFDISEDTKEVDLSNLLAVYQQLQSGMMESVSGNGEESKPKDGIVEESIEQPIYQVNGIMNQTKNQGEAFDRQEYDEYWHAVKQNNIENQITNDSINHTKIEETKIKFDRNTFDSYWEAFKQNSIDNHVSLPVESLWKTVQADLPVTIQKYLENAGNALEIPEELTKIIEKNPSLKTLYLNNSEKSLNNNLVRYQRAMNYEEETDLEAGKMIFGIVQNIWKNDFFNCFKQYTFKKFWVWVETAKD